MTRLFLLILFISTQVFAQKNTSIFYEQYENNQLQENRSIDILTDNNTCAIVNSTTTERFYIDYTKKQTIKTAELNKINYAVYTSFDSLSQATKTNDTTTILGFLCKKITFNVFSNRYEVWYTEQANTNASPSISFATPKGAVLKITINGNRTILAKSFTASEKKINFVASEYTKISEPKYVATQIKSRYTVLPVFEKEQINFDNELKTIDANESNKTYRFCKGNIILKKITLPKNSEKGLFYAKLTDWSNGDAYDRVGSVFTFSTKNDINILKALEQGTNILPNYVDNKKENYQGIVCTKEYTPAIELMRFFTPFGVGHFNNKRIIDGYDWATEANYKAEITSLIPSDENEIWIGVYIGNYDKGGHKVSLEIDFYPEPEMETYKKTILPLFDTVNIMEACGQNYGRLFEHDTLIVSFEITDSIKDAQLLFTSTGHGGWGGGDEFNPKTNQVFIDGKEVFHYAPWRNDCATYRLLNPSSGNFPDGLSSSDLSRSNWCPGTMTPPFYIPLKNLNPGLHTLKLAINQGTNEGGSFSHWCTSGVIVGMSK
jgi:GLPGLI family protein